MSKFLNALLLFIVGTVIGLVIYYYYGEDSNVWKFLASLDTAFSISLGILAGYAYYQMQRGEDEIKIVFNLPNKEIDTKLTILRKEVKRSEILGLLRMLERNQGDFKIASLQNPDFLKLLHNVQKNYKTDKIKINISKDELEQFKIMEEL